MIQDKNETEITLILKTKLEKLYNDSKENTSIIQKDKEGYSVLGKTRIGISMRQMYLKEKGYDFK